MSLDVGEEVKLLLLQRVHDGAITEYCDFYFDAGRRIYFYSAAAAYAALVEVGRIELVYPPDSGVHRQKDYGSGELVRGVHVGLTQADPAAGGPCRDHPGLFDERHDGKTPGHRNQRLESAVAVCRGCPELAVRELLPSPRGWHAIGVQAGRLMVPPRA